MKSSVRATRFALVAAALVLAAIPMFAATTATLALSGTVAPITQISLSADPNASALPVGTATTDMKIASVTEISNDKAGYSVTLSSLNGSMLKEANGSDTLTYTLNYGGNPVSFLGSTATLTNSNVRSGSASGTTNQLTISFPAAFLNADSYSDTLTFTITGN